MRRGLLCLWLLVLFHLPVDNAEAAVWAIRPSPIRAVPSTFIPQQDETTFETDVRGFLDNYCLSCHDGADDSGKLDLGADEYPEDARANPDLYWLAAYKIWDHSMPPPRKRKQPSEKERAAFLAWVDSPTGLGVEPHRGKTVLRRLNRSQYRRSIQELFDLTLPDAMVTNLPEDESGDGFDNIGASLTLSDEAFIRYLETAEFIADQLIRIPAEQMPTQYFVGTELEAPNKSGTNAALYSRGEAYREIFIKQAGRYRFHVGAWGNQAGEEACRMALVVDHKSVLEVDVTHDEKSEGVFAEEVYLDKGSHRLAARFLNDYYNPSAPNGVAKDRNLYVSWLELEGPLDPLPATGFQVWLLGNHFGEEGEPLDNTSLRPFIDKLISHVWRRKPTREEQDFYLALLKNTNGPIGTKAQSALIAALLSPYFLFETTATDSGFSEGHSTESKPRLRNGVELATHISLFLWSSYPDAELLIAAADPSWVLDSKAISEQVDRMLMDPRAIALAEDFASQCFRIRGLTRHEIDPVLFGDVDRAIMDSMLQETFLFFMDNLQNGRDLNELLSAEYSFMNQELASHYGIEWNGDDENWLRVDLSKTSRRGLLGHASVLTVTSLPTRTAPVRRGKWIMENLLGAEPPPPPANAGQLDESPSVIASAPLRERLAAHRDNPDCISCHLVMDPLGFSLENFDAVGRWRDQDGAFPVDAGGVLPDGTEIKGLKDLVGILEKRGSFSRLLVSRLSSYALGRTLIPADRLLVQGILDQLDPQNPSLRQAIQVIVASESFRNQ